MAIDEELLKPSRERLALLNGLIAKAEREMVEAIEHWGKDEYAQQRTQEYYMVIKLLSRERDGVAKIITDYYALQPMPTILMPAGTAIQNK